MDEFHQTGDFGLRTELNGENGNFQVFASGVAKGRDAEIGGLQSRLPQDFGNTFVDLAFVARRGRTVFNEELFGNTLFNASLRRQGKS